MRKATPAYYRDRKWIDGSYRSYSNRQADDEGKELMGLDEGLKGLKELKPATGLRSTAVGGWRRLQGCHDTKAGAKRDGAKD